MKANQFELLFSIHLKELKIQFQPEYCFHPDRNWRCDFYLPEYCLVIEIEGAPHDIWKITKAGKRYKTQGGHRTTKGFMNDIEKYNAVSSAGFKLFRFTPQQVNNGYAKKFVKDYIDKVK